jgi:hypothetical protein
MNNTSLSSGFLNSTQISGTIVTVVNGTQSLSALNVVETLNSSLVYPGQTITATIHVFDQSGNPTDASSLQVSFANAIYYANHSGLGAYSITLGSAGLVGFYPVLASAFKQGYFNGAGYQNVTVIGQCMATATGNANVCVGSSAGVLSGSSALPVSSVSTAPPSGLTFPDGLFSFTVSGLSNGQTITVMITLTNPLPAGLFSYWKYNPITNTWAQLPASKASLDSTRTVITLTLTDGQSPDDSDGLANGVIVDPGGPAISHFTGPYVGFTFFLSKSGGITVNQGGSGSNTITVTAIYTSQPITLSCTNPLPSGAVCGFNPASSMPPFQSTLTITTLPSTPVGSYTITVTGVRGTEMETTMITLRVNP